MKSRAVLFILGVAGLLSAALAFPQEKPEQKRELAPAAAVGIQGVWELKAKQGATILEFTLELRQEGGTLAGKIIDPAGRSLPLNNISFSDGVLKFAVPDGNIKVEGRAEYERLAGTYTEPGGNKDTWEAKRRSGVVSAAEAARFTSAADVEIGRKYFLGHCALCHGPEGEGGRGANLTTGQYRHGGSEQDLFRTIRAGVRETEMPGSDFADAEVWRLVAFVRRLAAAGAEEKALGDVEAGRIVYQTKGACAQCHMVDRQGGVLGPDLSDIGLRRSLKFLRQAVVEPDSYVDDNYHTISVTTLKGEQIFGVRLNEDENSIQLRDTREQLRSFMKRNLKDSRRENRSLMPGYGSTLAPAEIDNLVAYLNSLRRKP